jgi:hypothetical protein
MELGIEAVDIARILAFIIPGSVIITLIFSLLVKIDPQTTLSLFPETQIYSKSPRIPKFPYAKYQLQKQCREKIFLKTGVLAKLGHLDGGYRGLCPFVPVLSARAVNGLLHVLIC